MMPVDGVGYIGGSWLRNRHEMCFTMAELIALVVKLAHEIIKSIYGL
jgi:hypothetical protein